MLMGGYQISALLDTGSEISIINYETAKIAKALQIRSTEREGQVHLAYLDGTLAITPGKVELPLEMLGRQYKHTFHILPTLERQMLIGTDL
ncbi:hypothetical protein P5V15_002646 [Pogonomyrmex californicus]